MFFLLLYSSIYLYLLKQIKMKKIFYLLFFFILGVWVVFAANNFLRIWKNWDANVSNTEDANDNFTLSWRLDLEDSRSDKYESGYRWKITWVINSDLFWEFTIDDDDTLWVVEDIELYENNSTWQFWPHPECWTSDNVEKYTILWNIYSYFWWKMTIESNSYFCSNQFIYLDLKSDSLWEKEVWNVLQDNLEDYFSKQKISISGIVKLEWNVDNWISNRWDWIFNRLDVDMSKKTIVKTNINKNIAKLFYTFSNKISNLKEISDFNVSDINAYWENFYLYDYSNYSNFIRFNWNNYINDWEILEIKSNIWDKIEIDWKKTIIVKSWNIYINSDLYNKNDSNSILTIISKKDKKTWKWWNIYIDADVTNIDAILIADWSTLSIDVDFDWNLKILSAKNNTNNLRKQLLIYGSVLSSNNIWTDSIPFWADYHEDTSYAPEDDNIYDFWNLRTFNVNYWSWDLDWDWYDDDLKIVPIDWNWWYLKNAWAAKCEWFNWENCDTDLRKSTKSNPLIIEYNSNIQSISPYIITNK